MLGQDSVSDIQSMIVSAAQQNNVDPNLALEVAQAESNYNQNAVSSAGAIGVMQLMPSTAAQYGADPTDTADNIQAGVSYLGDLVAQYGDTGTALAAYNWGPGNVNNAITTYGTAPVQMSDGSTVPAWFAHAPAETQGYVKKILGNYAVGAGTVVARAPVAAAAIPGYTASLLPSAILPSATSVLGVSPWILVAIAGGLLLLIYVGQNA
jgi:hypothetical protein